MSLKRKIYQQMLDWKTKDNGKSALLIEGARRVGKSYIVEQFAKQEYESYLLIDFAKAPSQIKSLFEDYAEDLSYLLSTLSSYYKVRLVERKSVIVFDEVQLCPAARQMIKYLVQDGRYDYIETGSLITLRKNIQDIVIPSEEECIKMYPFDFEEFLWATGDELTYETIRNHFDARQQLGQALHRNIMKIFREYMLVGGMPQAVESYVQNKNFEEVDRVKKRILRLYREDIAKFASGYESRVYSIFDSIPGQLSKKEKKYKLSSISKDARRREYEDAFVWLDEAMVVNPCYNATDPNIGLRLSEDHQTQKIYMADTGLLVSLAFRDDAYVDNQLYSDILLDKISVNEGMLMENIVSQMLKAAGHELFFYSRMSSSERTNNIEIDFLIKSKRKICPVEVKSSAYRQHSSLDKFIHKFDRKLGDRYILYPKDVMVKNGIIHLPLYMAGLL